MNLQHLAYAVEIQKAGSISKAAENLFMGQPNLSRAVRDLEDSLGIIIFERTPKGIKVTPEGEEFLGYARRILMQVDEVESLYKSGKGYKQKFSACVPRASYISYALCEFAKRIDTSSPAEIFYKETNTMRTMKNVLHEEYNLGIIRYQVAFEDYFKRTFEEKNLSSETINEFSYIFLTAKNSPLANKSEISPDMLSGYIEVSHADPYVPSLPLIDVKKSELSEYVDKHLFIFERGSQFVLLEKVPMTFMWVSPIPDELLEKYSLVQIKAAEPSKLYRDVMIHRRDYRLTDLDRAFIAEVINARNKFISDLHN